MKKLITHGALALALLAGASAASAQGTWSAAGNMNDLRVWNGLFVFGALTGITLDCGTSNFRTKGGDPQDKTVVAMLLLAQATGQKIELYQVGCQGGGTTTLVNGIRFSSAN